MKAIGTTGSVNTSLQQLLEARLWVARLGENDVNRWWRTDGILGPDGAYVGPRVLPKTHPTARARIAFAVARHACDDRYPEKAVRHLFRLDPETEDRFDAMLMDKLEDFEFWGEVVERLEAVSGETDVRSALTAAGIATKQDLKLVEGSELGPAGRSLEVPLGDDFYENIRRLAGGFVHSNPGELTVPYIRNGK